MSTKSSRFYAEDKDTGIMLHVYWEWMDSCFYLEIEDSKNGVSYEEQPVPDILVKALRLKEDDL